MIITSATTSGNTDQMTKNPRFGASEEDRVIAGRVGEVARHTQALELTLDPATVK